MTGDRPGRLRWRPSRVAVAGVIMVAVDGAAMYSMAAHVAWGWHLLGLLVVVVAGSSSSLLMAVMRGLLRGATSMRGELAEVV